MTQLSVKDLAIGYDRHVLTDGISFQIESGDYVCMIGENGTGKSTLMKTLLGLQPALKGNIEWGEGVTPQTIGYLPQQTEVQKDFPATVFEIVLSGCQNRLKHRFFYSKADKATASDQIERLEITDLTQKCYRELSGGQQQRVLLARALCASKKMIFLDEPVTGLDPGAVEQMYSIINKLNHDGMTIMMISHDVDTSVQYASHILNLGSNVQFKDIKSYKSNQNTESGGTR